MEVQATIEYGLVARNCWGIKDMTGCWSRLLSMASQDEVERAISLRRMTCLMSSMWDLPKCAALNCHPKRLGLIQRSIDERVAETQCTFPLWLRQYLNSLEIVLVCDKERQGSPKHGLSGYSNCASRMRSLEPHGELIIAAHRLRERRVHSRPPGLRKHS
nr:hypothetical protein CFP56_11353 [Quercus suber]